VFRRISIVLILLAVASAAAAPTLAKSTVIGHKSSKSGVGYVDLIRALPLHHKYRIQVTGHKHSALQGYGYENYTYLANGRFQEGTNRLTFGGSIPRNFILSAPLPRNIKSLLLGTAIWTKDRKALTVKFLDLGKAH